MKNSPRHLFHNYSFDFSAELHNFQKGKMIIIHVSPFRKYFIADFSKYEFFWTDCHFQDVCGLFRCSLSAKCFAICYEKLWKIQFWYFGGTYCDLKNPLYPPFLHSLIIP